MLASRWQWRLSLKPRWLLFHFLLSLYPLTFFIGSNPELLTVVTPDEVWEILTYCLIFFSLQSSLHIWRGSPQSGLLIYAALYSSYLWRPYHENVKGSLYVVFLIFIVVWLAVLMLIRHWMKSKQGQSIVAFSLLILSLQPCLLFVMALWMGGPSKEIAQNSDSKNEEKSQTGSNLQTVPNFLHKPNVYLLVFDSMTSFRQYQQMLQSQALKDGENEMQQGQENLKKLGFHVLPEAKSNYGRTQESMLSFFKMHYLKDSGPKSGPKPKDDGFHHFPHSPFWKVFKDQGYQTIVSTASRSNTQFCPHEIDHCLFMPREDVIKAFIMTGTPFKQFITVLDRVFFRDSLFQLKAWLLSSVQPKKVKHVEQVQQQLHAMMPFQKPTLTYLHFYGPHPPNTFNRDCQDPRRISIFEQNSGESRNAYFSIKGYLEEYLCFLKQAHELAEQLISQDPEAWIILMSDHGPGVFQFGVHSRAAWDLERRNATFSVLRASRCGPRPCPQKLLNAHSNINLSRAIINELVRQSIMESLPDQFSDLGFSGPGIETHTQ